MIESPYNLFLTCIQGFETTCSQELKSIGISHRKITKGGVSFFGTMEDIYKVNYLSRTGMILWVEICSLNIKNEHTIYNSVYKNDWEKLFKTNYTFSFKCIQKIKKFKNTHYIALKGKDAIVDYFTKKNLVRPGVNTKSGDLNFLILIDKTNSKLLMNTSGYPLYKRNYKSIAYSAPINEVLASSIVKFIEWNKQDKLFDPFCGSGTIAIEAAQILKNIPAGKFRKNWAFYHLPEFDKSYWENFRDETNAKIKIVNEIFIHASDINNNSIQIAKIHAKKANVDQNIKFRNTDIKNWFPFSEKGKIVTNPPYGIRLNTTNELKYLYSKFGDILKNRCENFVAYLICGNRDLIKKIGLKTFLKLPLRIGNLDGRLIGYKIYKGSKKKM